MIYLVEDDESIRELVIYTLKSQGFEAKGFERPSLFWKALEKEQPVLLLLDVMLPEEDGISILKKLRMRPDTRKLPIIMLTAKSSEYDTVVGLDSGADDYIPKPFEAKELLARIRAVLRRSATPGDEKELRFPGLTISLDNYTVTLDGKQLDMPPKEIELLFFLASREGKVFTREQLLEQVWGFDFFGDSRTVDVHIKRIREKIGERPEWEIKTVWGVGYKFETAK